MSRMNSTTKTIGDKTFVLFPFGAFYAANLSGELARLLGPFLVSIFSIVDANSSDLEGKSIGDLMPTLIPGFQSLHGDDLEMLLKKLLVNQKNISVQYRDDDGKLHTDLLTWDLADEIFSQHFEDMLQLALEVINLNWSDFFTKLRGQYGGLIGSTEEPSTANTVISM